MSLVQLTFNACHLSKYKRSQFLEPSFGFFCRSICFGMFDGPRLVPKLLGGVSSGKIDQRGTSEGNKAEGEYRYCNGRRYCHYSGPYTGHASTQWSPDPSKEVPTLPQPASLSPLIIYMPLTPLEMDSSCAASQCGLWAAISYRPSLIGRGRGPSS